MTGPGWNRPPLLPGAALLAATLIASCATERASVPLVATPEERSSLVGEWHGRYAGPQGRAGSIVLFVKAGEDHAHGDVLMVPEGRSQRYGPSAGGSRDASPARRGLELLTIRFVEAGEGRITGMLDPYWDPDCQCEVWTSFDGRLEGDRIAGTFSSISGRRGVGRSSGAWEVRRRTDRSAVRRSF